MGQYRTAEDLRRGLGLALGALLGSMVLVLALAWMADAAGASCSYRPTDRPPGVCDDTTDVSSGPSGIALLGAGTVLGGAIAASWLGIERSRRRWRQLAEPTVPAAP